MNKAIFLSKCHEYQIKCTELQRMIKEAEKIRAKQTPKYIHIKPYGEDEKEIYYRQIAEIIVSPAFQQFMFEFREKVFKIINTSSKENRDLLVGEINAVERLKDEMFNIAAQYDLIEKAKEEEIQTGIAYEAV